KNFYGFEYLVAPYAVSHLKLSQLLKDVGYSLKDDERFQVYLTDTLDDGISQIDWRLPAISQEGKKANKIKCEEPVLVITGNPPYNIHSRNNKPQTLKLNKDYIPVDEKNVQPLNDDYIKFIRFANMKMENNVNGVVGIITNNSYLNGLLHRKMRSKLLTDFNEIYILNLHGNSRIGETCPDGSTDENVFDIQQGVAISFFIKKESNEPTKLFYYDLYGKREDKNEILLNNDISTMDWKRIDFNLFNEEFGMTRWGKTRFQDNLNFFSIIKDQYKIHDYGSFWGMRDIFKLSTSGITSGNDKKLISFNRQFDFNDYDKQKVEIINYRPFDNRFIYFDKSKIQRNRINTMKYYLINCNLGLCYLRITSDENYNHVLVNQWIVDKHFSGSQNYNSPLYLYNENSDNLLFSKDKNYQKYPNFTDDFIKFLNKRYSLKPSPEQVLGYIYAILYSPSFREKYLELLKIDFPRISFLDEDKFIELSKLGSELIDHHLLKKTYPDNLIKTIAGTTEVNKVSYKDSKVYINEDFYFYPIKSEVWNFYIGGYKILEKWLKARKGRYLNYSEINHFIKVCNVIEKTIGLMGKIDEVVKF
ncbi:MAG: type ISP restriction/modification enzyme, partial [Candidatus Celaenobacter polaris]|nr:type ISP restriction/modification enzyme [Candidatus Celaenobacter polaris]